MKNEHRVIKATLYTGWTELLIGLIMAWTGWQQWYYEHFHFFGILGMGMLIYSMWHAHFLHKDTGEILWKMKQ